MKKIFTVFLLNLLFATNSIADTRLILGDTANPLFAANFSTGNITIHNQEYTITDPAQLTPLLKGVLKYNTTGGFTLLGKYYQSIFALPGDITLRSDGGPNDPAPALFNMITEILRNAATFDPTFDAFQQDVTQKQAALQETVKVLISNLSKNEEYIKILQGQTQALFDQINPQSSFSSLSSLQAPDTLTTDSLLSTTEIVSDIVNNRVLEFNIAEAKGETSGIAAGDDLLKSYGLWVKGFLSYAKQEEVNLLPEHKDRQGGFTVGFDVGEDYIVGIAYTAAHSKIKHPNNIETIESNLGTLYNLLNFDNNLFFSGQARYGKADINKLRSTNDLGNNVARGDTKATLAGGRMDLGYYYNFVNNLQLIPTIGVSHDDITVKKYTETGGGLNRTVNRRNGNKTAALLGVTINYSINTSTLVIIPELHINIDHTVKRKNDKTTITLFTGMVPVETLAGKPSKTLYKIGTSVKISKIQSFDLSVGYDLALGKKYYSHAGSIQTRVNF